MKLFTRDDGQALRVIDGLRQQVLAAAQYSPRVHWEDEQYAAKASKKVRLSQRFVEEYRRHGGTLEGARVLEVACGAGIDSLLIAMHPVRSAVGIDMELPLVEPGERRELTRRLAREVLTAVGRSPDVGLTLQQLPIHFARMDAKRMAFDDHSFDLLFSRASMEHIVPPEQALLEMARVVRPGGLIYHGIDPFYWLKGCHKGGVVDIPWAHARLTPAEFHRFTAEQEGAAKATRRSRHLLTLNQLTPRQWRATLQSGPFEILQWTEESWPLAERMLQEHPDVLESLLEGIEPGDLTCREIRVWLRNQGTGAR